MVNESYHEPELARLTSQYWFYAGFVVLTACIIIFFYTRTNRDIGQERNQFTIITQNVDGQLEFPSDVGMLIAQVPLYSKREVTGSSRSQLYHDSHFVSGTMMKERIGKWSIEIVILRDDRVIRDYLASLQDSSSYYFFRKAATNQIPAYALHFGQFTTQQAAQAALDSQSFSISSRINVRIVQIQNKDVDRQYDDQTALVSATDPIRSVRLRRLSVRKDYSAQNEFYQPQTASMGIDGQTFVIDDPFDRQDTMHSQSMEVPLQESKSKP